MTLQAISQLCSLADCQRIISTFGLATRLDDVCSVQQVYISGNPTNGIYNLKYGALTTDPLAWNADQYTVQQALRNLIGLQNTVVESNGDSPNFYHYIKLVDIIGPATALTAVNNLSPFFPIGIAQVVTGSQQALDDCVVESSEECYRQLMRRYSVQQLGVSNWVNRFASMYAVDLLCSRRGNPVPQGFADRMEKLNADMETYSEGRRQMPGIMMLRTEGPLWSNIRVLPRYNFRAQRVERSTSSRVPQTSQQQDIDWVDNWVGPYEWW